MGNEKVFTTAPSPESQGIPSRAILNFLQRIDSERICMHGFLLVRHNKIAAEGYWAPWSAERMHRMYSVSKSFVALAVGMMIDEGRLTLDDRVAEYFPDKLPEELHPWLAASTVRDLLTMSTPHSTTSYTRDDPGLGLDLLQLDPLASSRNDLFVRHRDNRRAHGHGRTACWHALSGLHATAISGPDRRLYDEASRVVPRRIQWIRRRKASLMVRKDPGEIKNKGLLIHPVLILFPCVFTAHKRLEDHTDTEGIVGQRLAILYEDGKVPRWICQSAACWLNRESKGIGALEHQFEHHIAPASVKERMDISDGADVVEQATIWIGFILD